MNFPPFSISDFVTFNIFAPKQRSACASGDRQVIADVRRIVGRRGPASTAAAITGTAGSAAATGTITAAAGAAAVSDYVPTCARELCNRLFHTCYMGTANSTDETQKRAAALAADLGAYHMDTPIDAIVAGFMTVRVCERELV